MSAFLASKIPLRGIANLLYPAACPVCSVPSPSPRLCPTCADEAPRIRPPFCAKCSESFAGDITDEFTCANCADRVLHFDAAVSAYRSRGSVRRLMHDFKYRRRLYLRHILGQWLDQAMDDPRLAGRRFDLLVPVPLHPARKRERGFNQAELLARQLARRRDLPLVDALQRVRYTTTQTQFDRHERMQNLKGAFRLRPSVGVRDCRVLLVDDVLTTGSTLSECAAVMRKAGASSVHALTAARA